MRHIAMALASVSLTVVLAGCGTGSVEVKFGMHADSGEPGPLLDVVELPDGHPPVLPPGHPPLLPSGHPPIPGIGMHCPGSDVNRGWRPERGHSTTRDEPAIISI